MEQLIAIENRNGIDVVDARALHEFLESKQEFAHWIKNRIDKYGFTEGQDFLTILSKSTGGRPTKEYALTIDAAKELAMVEGNEKGKQARRYFIECEKRLKAAPQLPDFNNPVIAARAWADQVEARMLAEKKAEENRVIAEKNAHKASYTDNVLQAGGCWSTTTIAKELNMSAIALNRKLQALGIQYRIDGHWVVKSPYDRKGLTHTETIVRNDKPYMNTKWTEEGRKFIHYKVNGKRLREDASERMN